VGRRGDASNVNATPDQPIRALVIACDPRVRRALSGLLLAGGRVHLVNEGDARCECDGVASDRCPDVVVIDLDRASEPSWLREIDRIRTRCPATAIVAVASSAEFETRARAAGVDVFVPDLVTAEGVCEAVDRAIRRGGRGPSPSR
jgi:chemotaxis response regulator CheB